MTTSETPPGAGMPYQGDEKDTLRASLDRHRDAVLWKLDGLDDDSLRRPMTPSGTSLLGLVKHLASVEYAWLVETFGREGEPLWFDPWENEDMRATRDETAERLTAFYARARAAADAVIAELPLDAVGRPSWHAGRTVSLRWVLVHMIEETARHAGHMDIVRELIDGATGDHRPT
ncbi:DinB family protein [Streptomyces sp. MUM 2J]|uniref:DinB family protein n=1 Tax=Streptomyces sp. MUM 2J TaxID=2791987 RepID=UPI001F0418B7|nr:DinB family protein [Streptomyces sp. MUM 2J]